MGLEHSKPLAQMQSEDIAAITENLGKQYAEAAEAIRENGVDGAFLASLNATEIQETLDDLGVKSRLHRRVLERKIAAATEESKSHIVCGWESLDESAQRSGLRRTSTMQSAGSAYSTRSYKSIEQKEAETKKLLDLMTVAAEQQMLERDGLMKRESELQQQILMCSNQAD